MSGRAPGQREVAHRIFAIEFRDATHTFTRSDEERAPKYVVSPTGACINRLFVVGVLTEVDQVNEETVRARIVDPTGAFVVYASQYQPDARAALQELAPPAFVAVTGKANTFSPDDSDDVYTSIRPEVVGEVDATTRDRWTVTTAEHTLVRLGRLASSLAKEIEPSEGASLAIERYDISPTYLSHLYQTCIDALRVVAGEIEAADPPNLDPAVQGDAELTLQEISEVGRSIEDALGLDSVDAIESVEVERPSAESESTTPSTAEDGEMESEQEPPPDPPEETRSTESDEEPVVTDDERAAVEAEFGTEFATGDEVDPPDPEPEEVEEPASIPDDDESTPDADEDLEAQVVSVLKELDEGEGVERERIIEAAMSRFTADRSAIEEALQSALMDGKCYEPAEDVLRPI